MAATMGVASQTSTRVLLFHPIQHRRTSSSPPPPSRYLLNQKSECVSLRGRYSQCNRAPVVSCRQSEAHDNVLSGSTRTVTTLLGMAVLFVKGFGKIALQNLNLNLLSRNINSNSMLLGGGELLFASLKDRPSGYLNTPLTVVAAGLGKWLDIYSGVLMVRVLLSWFPNIPWERQPLSAIRDLCDPYLNLFRNIIPPIFDTLDVSPLLAFAVLGTLGSILQTAT
ncbi:ylmG homolog protein 1-2, chloroplastic-like [Gastrolobium bilobum]|uniref:ylmG homolog protein 1-2, chloroplastic-like n=1 Tax=Gastrolobium bilobum TaxID=150636 RepID=UPI002AB28826|nr:ylmG homolog protein 1-2, chloroplastic-like [Gastrolobium bilobum]